MKIHDNNNRHYGEPIPVKEGRRDRDEQQFLEALNHPAPLLPPLETRGQDSGIYAQIYRQPAVAGHSQALTYSQVSVSPVSGLVRELAEKINTGKNQTDITIRFKSESLPGTEVHIVRNAGDLQISFATQIASNAAFLRSHQQELVSRLRQKFVNDRVTVDIALAIEPQSSALGPASVNAVLLTKKS